MYSIDAAQYSLWFTVHLLFMIQFMWLWEQHCIFMCCWTVVLLGARISRWCRGHVLIAHDLWIVCYCVKPAEWMAVDVDCAVIAIDVVKLLLIEVLWSREVHSVQIDAWQHRNTCMHTWSTRRCSASCLSEAVVAIAASILLSVLWIATSRIMFQ